MVGCQKDSFKQSCLESRAILDHATNLLVPSVEQGNQNNVIVKNENSKAKEYLEKKDSEIMRHYNLIKKSILSSSSNYHDAIYAASYINEVHFFLTGNVLDDRCYYLNLVEKNQNVQLSDWLINEFFAPLKSERGFKNSWINLDYEKKRQMILRILTEARKDCKKQQQ